MRLGVRTSGLPRRLVYNVTPKRDPRLSGRAVKRSEEFIWVVVVDAGPAGKPRLGRSLALPEPLLPHADTPIRFPNHPIENPFLRAVFRKRLRNFASMNAKAAEETIRLVNAADLRFDPGWFTESRQKLIRNE